MNAQLKGWYLALCGIAIGGCANAPKVVDVNQTDAKHSYAFYSLPKVAFQATVVGEKHSFTPGAITAELTAWRKAEQKKCTYQQLTDPQEICFWRLRSKMPSTDGALASCATDGAYGQRGLALLRIGQAATLTTTSRPDPSQHFAVQLGSQLFEQTEVTLAYSPSGALSSFTAKSTSLVAETLESFLAQSINLSTNTGAPGSITSYPNLTNLVQKLAQLHDDRKIAASRPDSAGALATIDARIAQLRELAEGSTDIKPLDIKVALDPASQWPTQAGEATCNSNGSLLQASGPVFEIHKGLSCSDDAAFVAQLHLVADACSRSTATAAAGATQEVGEGLRYRFPVTATATIALTCEEPWVGACRNMPKLPVAASVVVPQWGPTLTLPRRLGWRSGSLDAKLDPVTGSLASLNATHQGSLEAALLADAYKDRAASKEAGGKDGERIDLERERAVLEHQVKICEARRLLQLPPGEGCP
jgi:hypothetical protein